MYTLTRRRFLAATGAALVAMHSVATRAAEPALRTIPRDGAKLPCIGLGTWQAFDIDNDAQAISEALKTLQLLLATPGPARLIDTSPMYGRAEAALGRLLAKADVPQRAFIATKVWTRGRAEGRAQIGQSLHLLGRQRIDLLQIHNLLDYDTHLATLQALKHEGRIRYIGATHYTAAAHKDLVTRIERGALDFVQVNYSVLEPEAAQTVFPAAAAHGVAVIVNRPFAEGELLRRTRGKPLPALARELGCGSWAQLALKFILGQPAVTCVIPGTRNPAYLADNIGAGEGAIPDEATCRRIADLFLA
ncbi:aldo/keto reductase [Tahibacter sp.]|uniref:aldo/keto reductase n=1 Tax=Tahibacter sp. TaxID=2056211 RepID=UPI0028C449D9|nr:aldo/keto reductase [Tahibacter sp.]